MTIFTFPEDYDKVTMMLMLMALIVVTVGYEMVSTAPTPAPAPCKHSAIAPSMCVTSLHISSPLPPPLSPMLLGGAVCR